MGSVISGAMCERSFRREEKKGGSFVYSSAAKRTSYFIHLQQMSMRYAETEVAVWFVSVKNLITITRQRLLNKAFIVHVRTIPRFVHTTGGITRVEMIFPVMCNAADDHFQEEQQVEIILNAVLK